MALVQGLQLLGFMFYQEVTLLILEQIPGRTGKKLRSQEGVGWGWSGVSLGKGATKGLGSPRTPGAVLRGKALSFSP